MAKKVNVFTVMAKLNVECTIEIKAESLEDAVEQVRKLDEPDFVHFLGDFIDGTMHVTGVYES